jgi:DEAD/DEAH box helicase domain-containing protein
VLPGQSSSDGPRSIRRTDVQPLILAEQTRQGVADFLSSTFPATTVGFSDLLIRFLAEPETLAKGPYVSVGLPFRQTKDDASRFEWLKDFSPHAHQALAFARLTGSTPRSTIVATGTGSGKTECFLYPVLEHCRQERKAGRRGIKAILIYPMNALATDQANRLAKEILTRPGLGDITAGLYVGDEPSELSTTVRALDERRYTIITDRDRMREEPPDILLTNYKMLDFLLIRARDSVLWRENAPDTLRLLVVDELHTFDGAQGTDLACLIRRLKARLRTPPGALVCVGTSATLGTEGSERLLSFTKDVFGEDFDAGAVIVEDRVSPAEYLMESSVEYVRRPAAADYETLSTLKYDNANEYVAAQHALWFGTSVRAADAGALAFRVQLGQRLKQHVAFQNLLRDLNRLGGRAVPLGQLVDAVGRRLDDVDGAPADYAARWLISLLALVSHASKDVKEGGERDPLLTVRVELWLRELRRMVASLDARPRLAHSDDLPADEKGLHLPIIHCRDCHAMGWGATVTKTESNKLKGDLQSFYKAFFSFDVSSRFIFAVDASAAVNPKIFERRQACPACGSLNAAEDASCNYCGRENMLLVDIASNIRTRRKSGAPITIAHHDCPYCEGERTLTIVGAQAASLSSIGVGQFFGSRYNSDKKLIAFSDSVQDAAHRAGFFESRTWLLNLRPAMAQVIHEASNRGTPLTLAGLPRAFESRWVAELGEKPYIKTFLPPGIAWLRDYDTLLREDTLPADGYLQRLVRRGLTWAMQAEFAQDAHLGRALPRTRTASLALRDGVLRAASDYATQHLRAKIDSLRGVTESDVEVFLGGFLARLRRVGAIWDEFLEAYANKGCNIFVYRSNNPAEYAMLKSPRRPRYLSLLPFGKCEAATGDEAGFYRDWALKALPDLNREVRVDDAVIVEIYQAALTALEGADVVKAVEAEREGTLVWGIRPDAYRVLGSAEEWRCDRCRNSVVDEPGAALTGTTCRQLGCRGAYVQSVLGNGEFYRQLYLSADIQRILAREHTGLLARSVRELVEKDFKQGRINLLSATPTLEMGIDIGDLSSVLLCSVPRAQANYLQRVGRAGRKTGNAFATTVAGGRPHDLYFWANPREMLAGEVDTPGVFLNASAVLERQLTAFSLDCWVRELGEKAKVPGKLNDVLSAIRNQTQSKYPYPWLAYIDRHRATLLAEFIEMFGSGQGELTPESRAYLEKFVDGGGGDGTLSWKVVNRLQGVIKDVDDLRGRRTKVDNEIGRVEALPARGDSDLQELKELKQERMALTKLMASISERDTLQFLTDEGLLPNYAFPEQGVLLHSVIIRDDRRVGPDPEDRVLTLEYERPGASAITEFAPNNAFYAEGRKITIEQVDISRDKPVQWRFCRSCSYAEPDSEPTATHCPRCNDNMWADAGRVQTMLRLSKVYARTLDSVSRIGDDTDDRERHFYVRQALVDVAPGEIRQAWMVDNEEYPFAFEFLGRVRFREINFGEQTGDGQPITIAGEEANRPGFVLCAECGTVQKDRRQENEWRNHALYCSKRKQPDSAQQECVFLYREFASEGMRLYLPDSTFGESEQCVQSFIAATQMGLEERFRGSVDHLRIARDIRIAQGQETPRQYLVIYDSVPGGTGYLKELMRDATPLFEVFKLALAKLSACGCNSDPSKDGCYSCLYGYHNSYGRKNVSRRTAVKLLAEIVGHQGSLKPVKTIGDAVPQNQLFDSQLERRFIEALRRKPADGSARIDVTEEIVRGKAGYFVKAGEHTWRVEPQVYLGPEQGVVIPSKPDFVLWPETVSGCLPIAVFLDGWQYHKERIGDDIAKRMAIARSRRFTVWSLTYDDIARFLEPSASAPESVWSSALVIGMDQAIATYERFGVPELTSFHTQTAFEQLRRRLAGLSDETLLRLGLVLALRVGAVALDAGQFAGLKASPAGKSLADLEVFAWPAAPEIGRCWSEPHGQLQIAVQARTADLKVLPGAVTQRESQPCVVLRWALEDPAISDTDRRRLWQQWWQAANLLMPVGNAWAVAEAGCELGALAGAPAYQAASGMKGEWESAAAFAASAVQGLLAGLFEAGVPAPEVGFELMGDDHCVAADCELAWPLRKVAVLLASGGESAFVAAGWKVFLRDEPSILNALIGLLKPA